MKHCAQKKDTMTSSEFSQVLQELCRLMVQMGSFMKMAFSDVGSKAEILVKNEAFFKETLGKHPISLFGLVEEEIALGVVRANGRNNSSEVKEYK